MPQYGFDVYRFDINKFNQQDIIRQIAEDATLEEAYYLSLHKLRAEGIELTESVVNDVYKVLTDTVLLADEAQIKFGKEHTETAELAEIVAKTIQLRSLPKDSLGLSDYHVLTVSPDARERVKIQEQLIKSLLARRDTDIDISEVFDIKKSNLPAFARVGVEGLRIPQKNLRISDTSNSRVSTCSFEVYDPSDAVIRACKMRAEVQIIMIDGNKTHYFGGRIINNPLEADGVMRKLTVEAEDYTAEAADFLVVGTFEGKITDILTELWETYYEKPYRAEITNSDETISVNFNYDTLFDATEYLVEQLGGWVWFVDFDGAERVLRIFPPEAEMYDRTISYDDLNPLADTPSFSYDTELANAIYLFGGEGISEEIVQTEVADGEKTIYYTYYRPVGLKLYVNGVERSVGAKYLHDFDEFDVLLNYQEKAIEFPEDSKPNQGDLIRYEYRYRYPIVTYIEDAESIAEYGKVVKRIEDRHVTTPEQARKAAENYLRSMAQPKLGGTLTVMDAGIKAGMYVNVNLPKYGAVGVFRVNQAEKWVEQNLIFCRLELNRITGSAELFAAKIKELAKRIDNLEARDRDDTIVQRYKGVGEDLAFTDRVVVTRERAGVVEFERARFDFGVFA